MESLLVSTGVVALLPHLLDVTKQLGRGLAPQWRWPESVGRRYQVTHTNVHFSHQLEEPQAHWAVELDESRERRDLTFLYMLRCWRSHNLSEGRCPSSS